MMKVIDRFFPAETAHGPTLAALSGKQTPTDKALLASTLETVTGGRT